MNSLLCILSLLFVIGWPVFVLVYTHRQKQCLERIEFNEYYEDVFYGRLSNDEVPDLQQSLYLIFRYTKYIFYAISASVLGNFPLGALILMILLQLG